MGVLLMAATDRGLCAVQFGDDEAVLRAALAAELRALGLGAAGVLGVPGGDPVTVLAGERLQGRAGPLGVLLVGRGPQVGAKEHGGPFVLLWCAEKRL